MKWRTGDRALMVVRPSEFVHTLPHDRMCTLVKFLGPHEVDWNGNTLIIQDAWNVRTSAGPFFVAERCLQRPDDHNDKGNWNECVWQPREAIALRVTAADVLKSRLLEAVSHMTLPRTLE